ncbi:MAG TPA: HAMP domain-containing sensor histidine kinase, partial [Vicinamibacterales bacterium]|nr:HAMP domain-containing sensor histidine kinase [Vicinamibacterales bacterium]
AEGYAGPLTPEQQDVVVRAQRRLASLHELIDDLLDLAAGKAGLEQSAPERLDLGGLVAEIVDRFRPVGAAKGVALTLDQPPEALHLIADRRDLERVFVNLVGNAVKYTARGEVRVRMQRGDGRIRVDVADSGIGIPKSALPFLFNEFYRAANAKAGGEPGTGLGLAIVKLLVVRHGGEIAVESEEGRGTTMTVTWPAAPDLA